jgi:hypothetical protein
MHREYLRNRATRSKLKALDKKGTVMNFTALRTNLLAPIAMGATLALSVLVPSSSATAQRPAPDPRIVYGQSITLSGVTLSTWAKVLPHGRVTQVGLTLPMAFVKTPPAQPASGPDGQFVLAFPKVVQQSTYFNHLELGWNPHGHEPEGVWDVPHFDFHFEGVPVQSIWDIGFGVNLGNGLFGDSIVPTPERMPAGYVYPGQLALVPFMGVHAFRPEDIVPSDQFTAVVLAGFYNGNMIFIEPMITQEFLLRRESFEIEVPRPTVLGRNTSYPTRFRGTYDKKADAYYFIFSHFVEVK